MRLTERDRRLIECIARSSVLSRNHILADGFFTSVTRLNSRMRGLINLGIVKRLESPFFNQSLYTVTPKSAQLLPLEIARLVQCRPDSPRFIQHSLAVTEVRIALTKHSSGRWLFEHELWRTVDGHQVRPDGAVVGKAFVLIEVDMGNVSRPKFKEKLRSYQALAHSGLCSKFYGYEAFHLLVICPGKRRANHLSQLLPHDPGFGFLVQTFESMGVARTSSWS